MPRRPSDPEIEKALKSYEWVVADMARRMSPVVSDGAPTVSEIERLELLSQRLGKLWGRKEQHLAKLSFRFCLSIGLLVIILEIAINLMAGAFVTRGLFLMGGLGFVVGAYWIRDYYSRVMSIRPVLSVHRFIGLYPLVPNENLDEIELNRIEAARMSVPQVKRYLEQLTREGRSLTRFEVRQINSLSISKKGSPRWSELSIDQGGGAA